MFEALRSCTRGRRSPAALALPLLLLALAVLPGANPAAAQLPEIEVYHSPNNEGDPESETSPPSPPGCDCSGSAAVGIGDPVTLNFDDLPARLPLPTPYEGVTFYTTPDHEVIAAAEAAPFGTSPPNVMCAWPVGGGGCDGEIFVNFSELAHDLSFLALQGGSSETSPPAGTVIAQVNVFESAWLQGTVDIVGGGFISSTLVDLSAFGCVNRIHIHSIHPEVLIGFDDFSFNTEGTCDCVVQGGTDERIDLFTYGGDDDSDPNKTVCMKGEEGGDGHELCGADIQLSLVGQGSFSNFVGDDTLDTLVHDPPCDYTDEGGNCEALPDGTKQLRMNFRRGGVTPTAEPRRVGKLYINSTGASPGNPTTVVAQGEAASAKLELRLIQSQDIAVGPSKVDCIPEPGEMMLLVSGLAGLALLYRLRGRP